MLLLNAFSLNMLETQIGHEVTVKVREVPVLTAKLAAIEGLQSAVGHAPTAAVFENELCVPIATARVTVKLKQGDRALIGQYSGPRLEEGATTLPPGATIKWMILTVVSHFDQDGNIFPPDDDETLTF